MKKETKNVLRIIISIVYIVWGIASPIAVIKEIIALDLVGILSAVVGVLTLLAGIFGLVGAQKKNCRIFGIVIFLASVVPAVLALPEISVISIVNAIIAWLFIICL